MLLHTYPGLRTKPCESLSVDSIKDVLRAIYPEVSPVLRSQYTKHDGRYPVYESSKAMEADWSVHAASEDLVVRDALCHEAVMWFAHHLSTAGQKRVIAKTILPLLPRAVHHDTPGAKGKFYQSKVSCQQCHTGPVLPDWVNDTMPVPPGESKLARQRSCDYQNDPPCGPCDGLGGPRTGDGVDQFTPMPCEVVAMAEEVPLADRAPHVYPMLGHSKMSGDARLPLEPPGNSTNVNGSYVPVDGDFYLGWDGVMGRHQYVRRSGSPVGGANATVTLIALQSIEMIKSNSSAGVMGIVSQSQADPTNKTCICLPGDAGVMHTQAFADVDPYDSVRLPASEGGLNYLGRVKVQLDGQNHTTIADHYMKVFFNFLVGAEKGTPTYGKPILLYASLGNRFIYSDWVLGDPKITSNQPDLWKLPTDTHCIMADPNCKELFQNS